MALIKCKNCGEEISDKSTKCVHCGYDTEYSITHFCPECGKEYDNIRCMNCGYSPNSKKDTTNQSVNDSFNFKPLLISLAVGIITFIIMSYVEGIFIVDIAVSVTLFLTCLGTLNGSLDDFVDTMEDFHASTDKDPYKRALYKQMKKNNKK